MTVLHCIEEKPDLVLEALPVVSRIASGSQLCHYAFSVLAVLQREPVTQKRPQERAFGTALSAD